MISVKVNITVPSDATLHRLSVYGKKISPTWLPLIRIERILLLWFLGCFVQQILQELCTSCHVETLSVWCINWFLFPP